MHAGDTDWIARVEDAFRQGAARGLATGLTFSIAETYEGVPSEVAAGGRAGWVCRIENGTVRAFDPAPDQQADVRVRLDYSTFAQLARQVVGDDEGCRARLAHDMTAAKAAGTMTVLGSVPDAARQLLDDVHDAAASALTPSASELRTAFEERGVLHLPHVLPPATMELAEAAFAWSLAHPGPAASRPFDGRGGAFEQDLCNPAAPTSLPYRALLADGAIPRVVTAAWGDEAIWFMYEQVFDKSAHGGRRTPWHQDSSYLSVDGSHLAVVWITLDPVRAEHALEFVAGSHRGPLYNTSAFDPEDETRPIADGLTRLPDIEADRARWDIVSWPCIPGDLVLFHPAVLHGGGATDGQRRRTVSLRYFGQDTVYAERPGGAVAPRVTGLGSLRPGEPFRNPAFVDLTSR